MSEVREGVGWNVWDDGKRSQLRIWGCDVQTALNHFGTPRYRWSFSFELRESSLITVLGQSHLASDKEGSTAAWFTATVLVEHVRARLVAEPVVVADALIWARPGSAPEYRDAYRITLTPKQYEVLSIWLDEQETRLGSGFSGLKGVPDVQLSHRFVKGDGSYANRTYLVVTATDPKGVADKSDRDFGMQLWGVPNQVGQVIFRFEGRTKMWATDARLLPSYQKQNLGTRMYQYAQQVSGRRIVPSDDQTDAGRAMWKRFKRERTLGAFSPPPKPPGLGALTLDDEDYELLTGQRPMTEREQRALIARQSKEPTLHLVQRPESNEDAAARMRRLRASPSYREAERQKNAARMQSYRTAGDDRAKELKAINDSGVYQKRLREKYLAMGLTSKGKPRRGRGKR